MSKICTPVVVVVEFKFVVTGAGRCLEMVRGLEWTLHSASSWEHDPATSMLPCVFEPKLDNN